MYFFSIPGINMVPAGSWVTAPIEAIILGLKELPHSEDPISQRHIFFAHAYKVRKLFCHLSPAASLMYTISLSHSVRRGN